MSVKSWLLSLLLRMQLLGVLLAVVCDTSSLYSVPLFPFPPSGTSIPLTPRRSKLFNINTILSIYQVYSNR
jgi:hypothetical protein